MKFNNFEKWKDEVKKLSSSIKIIRVEDPIYRKPGDLAVYFSQFSDEPFFAVPSWSLTAIHTDTVDVMCKGSYVSGKNGFAPKTYIMETAGIPEERIRDANEAGGLIRIPKEGGKGYAVYYMTKSALYSLTWQARVEGVSGFNSLYYVFLAVFSRLLKKSHPMKLIVRVFSSPDVSEDGKMEIAGTLLYCASDSYKEHPVNMFLSAADLCLGSRGRFSGGFVDAEKFSCHILLPKKKEETVRQGMLLTYSPSGQAATSALKTYGSDESDAYLIGSGLSFSHKKPLPEDFLQEVKKIKREADVEEAARTWAFKHFSREANVTSVIGKKGWNHWRDRFQKRKGLPEVLALLSEEKPRISEERFKAFQKDLGKAFEEYCEGLHPEGQNNNTNAASENTAAEEKEAI